MLRIDDRSAVTGTTLRRARRSDVVAATLQACHERGLVDAVSWVVMPDHVHWMFALRQSQLSDIAREFKSRSARDVNRVLGRTGPVWQAGFYDHRLRGDDDLREQARYVVINPVRAGLVDSLRHYPHWWCRYVRADR